MVSATRLVGSALALSWLVPGAALAQSTHFSDVSESMGVLFHHRDGPSTFGMGGGSAWFDWDNDGDEDLFCASSDGQHALFENQDLTFVDVAASAGLITPIDTNNGGVIAGDLNQDGWADLYLSNRGPNMLMTAQGDGTFVEEAAAKGIDGFAWSESSTFCDFDRDGDLDIYVGNYVRILNFPYHFGWKNDFYVNDGTSAEPLFTNKAEQLGVDDSGIFGDSVPGFPFIAPTGQETAGCTLSVATSDYNEDGWPDIMVGNDFGEWVLPDRLYRNDMTWGASLGFTDVTVATGFDARPQYNMGINGADYDHDGDWDYYMSDLGENVLLRNDDGFFNDDIFNAGPVEGFNDAGDLLLTSWGTSWADFDNDLWEDMFVVNGYIPAASFIDNDTHSPNNLWMNNHDGTFTRVDQQESGAADIGGGRGLSTTDINRDGLMDFYVMNNGAPLIWKPGDACRLFINNGTLGDPTNRWIQLQLRGWLSNLEGIGARIDAEVPGHTLKRQLLADAVFLSAHSRIVHFGLGQNDVVDRISIHWPSGQYQELVAVPAKQIYEFLEPRVTVRDEGVQFYDTVTEELVFPFNMHNARDVAVDATCYSEFRLGENGPILLTQTQLETIAAHHPRRVEVRVPIPADVYAGFKGIEIEHRIYVSGEGAIDSRSQVLDLP